MRQPPFPLYDSAGVTKKSGVLQTQGFQADLLRWLHHLTTAVDGSQFNPAGTKLAADAVSRSHRLYAVGGHLYYNPTGVEKHYRYEFLHQLPDNTVSGHLLAVFGRGMSGCRLYVEKLALSGSVIGTNVLPVVDYPLGYIDAVDQLYSEVFVDTNGDPTIPLDELAHGYQLRVGGGLHITASFTALYSLRMGV